MFFRPPNDPFNFGFGLWCLADISTQLGVIVSIWKLLFSSLFLCKLLWQTFALMQKIKREFEKTYKYFEKNQKSILQKFKKSLFWDMQICWICANICQVWLQPNVLLIHLIMTNFDNIVCIAKKICKTDIYIPT